MSRQNIAVLIALYVAGLFFSAGVGASASAQPLAAMSGSKTTGADREKAPARRPSAPGAHSFTLRVGDLDRRYYVHIPIGYDAKTSSPIVLALHGKGETAAAFMRNSGWTRKANASGFLAVFPEALPPDPARAPQFFGNPPTWSDRPPPPGRQSESADDLGFLAAVLDEVTAMFGANPKRIYATGFAEGGSMVFQLALAMPERIAAIAPVAGCLWAQRPKLKKPVSMIYIVGASDPLMPLSGGRVRLPGGRVETRPPVSDMVRQWADLLGCPPQAKPLRTREGVAAVSYGPGRENSEVVFYTVKELGHVWPGGRRVLSERLVGKASNVLDANDVIWNFFLQHVRQ
ncbi:MAG: hypothetical protein N3D11_09065 [Candidatus Sumerlaeia bacterium]|nr:hypothetical protein [Candidatus Sumerlaeia bacterium]